jgi:hypothetical protein
MKSVFVALALILSNAWAGCALAEEPTGPSGLRPALAGLSFMVGHWSVTQGGHVTETGGTASGSSIITVEASGGAILSRGHTDLFDPSGKPAGSFGQLLLIYPEAGVLHADYSDGAHVIHYTSAVVQPGQSVVFMTATQPGAPTFKLTYAAAGPKGLAINFAMAPPGASAFQPIATGVMNKGE